MSGQPPPPPQPVSTTPRQSRRGRRRANRQDDGGDEQAQNLLLASSPQSTTSAASRKWTRSLSPRRLVGRGNDESSTDIADATIMSQLNASFGSGLVASIKRLTGRGARSQSPMPRKDLMGPLESPAVARITQKEEERRARSKSPKRSRSNPRFRPSTSGQNLVRQPLIRSKSDSAPRSRLRRRSVSPKKAPSDELMSAKKDDTGLDSRSGRNAPLRPPSGLNLRQVMEKHDQMDPSYTSRKLKDHEFMLLESDGSEVTTSFSPTVTMKKAVATKDHAPQFNLNEKQMSRPSIGSSSQSSSRSHRRPRSARHMKSLNDSDDEIEKRRHDPLSSRSLDMPPPQKPSSDPGKGSGSVTPSRRPPSFRNNKTSSRRTPSTSSSTSKAPSVKNLTTPSNHEKPSSDPGRYGREATNTKPPRSSSNASSKSSSSSSHVQGPVGVSAQGSDKVSRPSSSVIERPNLNKESLQHVADVKDSIRRMRTQQYAQRHKVQFTEEKDKARAMPVQAPKSNPSHPSTAAPESQIASTLQESQSESRSSFPSHNSSSNSLTYTESQNASSVVRLQPGIAVSDLEVGFLKAPVVGKRGQSGINEPQGQQPLQPPSVEKEQHDREKVQSLVKSIKKTKKLIKRTCRDVWAERDEVVHLQRTNWSIRKALLQTDVPKDSVTSLNLKIENALRQEREVSDELTVLQDEKYQVDLDCSMLAKSIEEFKNLLDALDTQVVPLFPTEKEVNDDYDYEHEGATATAAVVQLMDDDDFDDSIHSTDE